MSKAKYLEVLLQNTMTVPYSDAALSNDVVLVSTAPPGGRVRLKAFDAASAGASEEEVTMSVRPCPGPTNMVEQRVSSRTSKLNKEV